jgi:hypothetical protein
MKPTSRTLATLAHDSALSCSLSVIDPLIEPTVLTSTAMRDRLWSKISGFEIDPIMSFEIIRSQVGEVSLRSWLGSSSSARGGFELWYC